MEKQFRWNSFQNNPPPPPPQLMNDKNINSQSESKQLQRAGEFKEVCDITAIHIYK